MTTPIARVGVVGLGIMGRPMAANLIKAGFDVTVHTRSRAKIEALQALRGVAQMVGNGWEWTRTPFHPFPGFEPFPFIRAIRRIFSTASTSC